MNLANGWKPGAWTRWAVCAAGLAATLLSCGEDKANPGVGEGATSSSSASGSGGAGGYGIGGINWVGGGTASGGGTGAGTPSGLPSCDGIFDEVALDCPAYCQLMGAHCNNGQGHFNDQYPGGVPDVCADVCPHLPVGTTTDPLGNTLACRIQRACMAEWDPDAHCTEAGPGGDGACGDSCESFCTLALSICSGNQAQWASLADCQSDCATFDSTAPYNTTSDNWSGTTNAYACRMYWLMRSVDDPLLCVHTKLGAANPDPCVDGI